MRQCTVYWSLATAAHFVIPYLTLDLLPILPTSVSVPVQLYGCSHCTYAYIVPLGTNTLSMPYCILQLLLTCNMTASSYDDCTAVPRYCIDTKYCMRLGLLQPPSVYTLYCYTILSYANYQSCCCKPLSYYDPLIHCITPAQLYSCTIHLLQHVFYYSRQPESIIVV